jgi:L-aminoadipate-semialdehyde dehydrogenase
MTDTQLSLAKIWGAIIPNRSARMFVPESNFFDEGGHSILAQQMFFRIKKAWRDIDVPVSAIFQSQTLEALAAEIDRALDPIGLRLDAMPLPGDGAVKDEAYAADGRDLAQQIPRSIPSHEGSLKETNSTVFLTGATGFLGAYILRELLEGPTQAKVIALVRAKTTAEGLTRLQRVCDSYGLWNPAWTSDSRVEVVIGDLAQSQLGLAKDVWDRISKESDLIVHNGAAVNWMLPYSSLRAANVLSTMYCIRLAAAGKPKRLAFVSSTSTLDSPHYVHLGKAVLETDDLEGSRKGLATGYGQSKWASEYIVREAGRRGLVAAIIRPGYITGDPSTGTSVRDDFLVRLWKGCLQVKARPDIGNGINVVPVTTVSRIVVAAAFNSREATGENTSVVQVTNHPRVTMNEWIGALETYGYTLPSESYGDWSERVKEYVSQGDQEEFALLPLFHFVVGDLPSDSIAPELDDANAAAVLRAYGAHGNDSNPLAGNAVHVDTIGTYLAYLNAVGFLPTPTGTGTKQLPAISEEKLRTLTSDQLGGRSARP